MQGTRVAMRREKNCNTAPHPILLHFLYCQTRKMLPVMLYCKNQEVKLLATSTTKERERIKLSGIASGLQQADTIGTLPVLSLAKSAPNETK